MNIIMLLATITTTTYSSSSCSNINRIKTESIHIFSTIDQRLNNRQHHTCLNLRSDSVIVEPFTRSILCLRLK